MDNKMFVINIIKTVFDGLISAFAIAWCAWGASHFDRWWILLFAILPLAFYYSSGIVVIGEPAEDENGKKEG